MRILYVEDNPANLFLVKRVARMGNHEVIGYIDGEEALTNFDRDKPDLVLMDIQLAGELSGLDVIKKLRELGHTVPIVAVTAYAMVGDRDRCIKAGCSEYLAKPLPVPQLVEIFQRFTPADVPVAEPEIKPADETHPTPADSNPVESEVTPAPTEVATPVVNENEEVESQPQVTAPVQAETGT